MGGKRKRRPKRPGPQTLPHLYLHVRLRGVAAADGGDTKPPRLPSVAKTLETAVQLLYGDAGVGEVSCVLAGQAYAVVRVDRTWVSRVWASATMYQSAGGLGLDVVQVAGTPGVFDLQ